MDRAVKKKMVVIPEESEHFNIIKSIRKLDKIGKGKGVSKRYTGKYSRKKKK